MVVVAIANGAVLNVDGCGTAQDPWDSLQKYNDETSKQHFVL